MNTHFKVVLSIEKQGEIRTLCELRSIEKVLLANGERLRSKVVRWGCDMGSLEDSQVGKYEEGLS